MTFVYGLSLRIRAIEFPLLVARLKQAELGQWVTELNACKKVIIERALRKTNGNRAAAAPAGSQPEIFLGARPRTQREIVCRGNRWFPRDADQQVREDSGFPEMLISKSGKTVFSLRC